MTFAVDWTLKNNYPSLYLFYNILSYLILSYLILSYLVLSCLILSYHILSYLILSYIRPGITVMVDWALKINYIIYLSIYILSYLILSYLPTYAPEPTPTEDSHSAPPARVSPDCSPAAQWGGYVLYLAGISSSFVPKCKKTGGGSIPCCHCWW